MNPIIEGRTDCQEVTFLAVLEAEACIPHLRKDFENLKYSVSCQTLIPPDLAGFQTVIFHTSHGHLHIKQLHLLSP